MPTEPNAQDLDAAMTAAMAGDPMPPPSAEPTPEPASLDAAMAEPSAPEPTPEPAEPAPPTEATAPTPTEPAKVEADPIEAEITGFNLKQKAAERMRDLSTQAKEGATLREALSAAGVTDVASLPELVERAKTAEEMVNLVVGTGANAEQYTQALDYLAAANAAQGGDMAAAEKVWAFLAGEMAVVGRMLGKEVPGVSDPLSAHKDLVDDVEDGNITRARALEVARARDADTLRQSQAQAQQQAQAGTQAQQQAIQAGKESLNDLGKTLLAADPDGYGAKAPILVAKLRDIARTFPPDQWATQGAIAYASIPTATKAPVRQMASPVRPTGPTPHLTPQYKSPEEALDAGIDAASAGY